MTIFFGHKRREWDLKVIYTSHAYIQLRLYFVYFAGFDDDYQQFIEY